MRSDRTYQIRRGILKALQEYNPAPASVDDILNYPGFTMLQPTREEAIAEWNELSKRGYITICKDSDGKYAVISADGSDQINGEKDREQFIWGKMGLKIYSIIAIALLILCNGCASYVIRDGNGNILSQGETHGILRTITVTEEYHKVTGKIIKRKISTDSNTKDVLMGLNELIDSTINTAGKIK